MVVCASPLQALRDLLLGCALAPHVFQPARPVQVLHLRRLATYLIQVQEDPAIANQPEHAPEQVLLLLVGQVMDREAGDDHVDLWRRFDRSVVGRQVPELGGPGREPLAGDVQQLLGEIDEREPGVGEGVEHVLGEQARSCAEIQHFDGAVRFVRDQAGGRSEEVVVAGQGPAHPVVVVVDRSVKCVTDRHAADDIGRQWRPRRLLRGQNHYPAVVPLLLADVAVDRIHEG